MKYIAVVLLALSLTSCSFIVPLVWPEIVHWPTTEKAKQ